MGDATYYEQALLQEQQDMAEMDSAQRVSEEISASEGTSKDENDVAIENAKKITHIDNPADPFRDAFGAGSKSHPEEWNNLIMDMEENGVEVVYREGAMGYGPLKKENQVRFL
ncbi:hypothetical protein [Paenibacillus rigui]|uniref:Uncharacterized protein n=1 Tax=Paenibacillus rigui TaxID=554312 RepID=A0A229UIS3_9BACL|nr:hypothetical protein [Paenibacillus rigui]OXM83272.1 hypothetical protein CF651_26455 [Paenibacillus rigui]